MCLIAGLIFSFGIVGTTHAPLQVSVNQQYQPATAPAPAIPTVVPAGTRNAYDPAPAPVVITTAPLPTITPLETTATGTCDIDPNSPSAFSTLACMISEMANSMVAFSPAALALAVIGFVLNILSPLRPDM